MSGSSICKTSKAITPIPYFSDKLAVYAVKQGKEAADAIDTYLKGGKKNA